MRWKTIRFGIVWICFAFLCACGGGSGGGGDGDGDSETDDFTPPERSLVSANPTLLMKAKPDECYVTVEDIVGKYFFIDGIISYVVTDFTRIDDPPPPATPDESGTCEDAFGYGEIPKTNEGYVWGLALAGDRLWMGTGANIRCLVQGGYLGASKPAEQYSGTAELTEVCEYGVSWRVDPTNGPEYGVLPPELGDWRPPSIHFYDLAITQQGYDVEDKVNDYAPSAVAMDATGRQMLDKTQGTAIGRLHRGCRIFGRPRFRQPGRL